MEDQFYMADRGSVALNIQLNFYSLPSSLEVEISCTKYAALDDMYAGLKADIIEFSSKELKKTAQRKLEFFCTQT